MIMWAFKVMIFTPNEEIPFAGHPTLGTAYIIIREFLGGRADRVVIDLKAGKIPVVAEYDGRGEIKKLVMKQSFPFRGGFFYECEGVPGKYFEIIDVFLDVLIYLGCINFPVNMYQPVSETGHGDHLFSKICGDYSVFSKDSKNIAVILGWVQAVG
ncbi:MAG: PhzF family phenazine biosynthesis protein [Peptococcaceae bacterium]|nr:PhzF family phenazine biosynthesis protein [Peptococcaceae bacterium]